MYLHYLKRMLDLTRLVDDGYCFACGTRNPIGLQLKFKQHGERVEASFLPKREYQGYNGVLHGGIIATLLDEALAWASKPEGITVTASLEVRFKKPIPIGEPLKVIGRITEKKKHILYGESWIEDKSGVRLAAAHGKLVLVGSKEDASSVMD